MTAFVAILCAGCFAGAALYVALVEQPARLQLERAAAIAEFRASFPRAAAMQASLAALGLLAGVAAWWQGAGGRVLAGGLLLGAVLPFTAVVITPLYRRLLDPALVADGDEAAELLRRWGRLHLVRAALGVAALAVLAP